MTSKDDTLNTAYALLAAGNVVGADREACAMLAVEPENINALCLLARCYLSKGQNLPARTLVEQVVCLAPEEAEVWGLLGLIEAGNGMFLRAEEAYLRALSLDPEDAFCHFCLARLYQAWARNTQAQSYFDKAIALEPDNVAVLCAYAGFLQHRGADADALVDRALQLSPDDPDLLVLLGERALARGALEEARARALWLLAQNGDDHKALVLLAKVRGRANIFLGLIMRLKVSLDRMSLKGKWLAISGLLLGFIVLRWAIMAWGPVWLHHGFVLVCVLVAGLVAITEPLIASGIGRERRHIRLKDGF